MPHNDAEDAVRENVHQMREIEAAARARDSRQDVIADKITRFSGSMAFVWLHVAIFAFWIAANLGAIPGVRPWDKYPFELLTMAVSLEAILLSTFVLLSQNRQQAIADSRQKLDLHMNLLSEEKATLLLQMLCRVSDQLDHMADHGMDGPEGGLPRGFTEPTNLLHVAGLVNQENEAPRRARRG